MLVACTAMVGIGLSSAGTQDQPPANDPFMQALVAAHNRVRKDEGKPALKVAPKLVQAALAHARDMAEHKEMSHKGSDGSEPAERVRRAGYLYINTAENVAAGHTKIAEVMKDWMQSTGHRANILGDFSEVGGARVKGGDGAMYWAVEFGTPVPEVDPVNAAQQAVDAVNALRRDKGLNELKTAPALTRVAEALAKKMASDTKPLEPDAYKEVYKQVIDEGYNYQRISMSVARGQFDGKEVVDGLAKAEQSDRTVLGDFADVGVGVSVDAEGHPSWVIFFGTRLER